MTEKHDLSRQHRKILDLLVRAGKPLSAYAILDALRDKGVRSPPTVYRALDKLRECGLVHRVESLGAFVACRCGHNHEHEKESCTPFAICTLCGDVKELDDPALVRAMRKLGDGFLAHINHKVFEVSGRCKRCQKKGAPHV